MDVPTTTPPSKPARLRKPNRFRAAKSAAQDDSDYLPRDHFFAEFQVAEAMPAAHWHDHVEFNFLLGGSMTYLFNGNRVVIRPGRPYCFWAGVPHQAFKVDGPAPLVCAYVPFTDFLALALPQAFKTAVLNGRMMSLAEPEPMDVLLFQRWAAEWSPPPGEALAQILREEVRLRLRRLALNGVPAEIEDHSGIKTDAAADAVTAKTKADDRLIDRVQKMTGFINREFAGDIQLADIARACGLHPTNAMAAFKSVLGVTIAQYIRRQRLSHAMMMLADTDRPIIEIAFACGYGSLSRFYSAFQRELEMTPRDYRLQFRS
jgi:AraC-like DNA-binding protein/mannose-6-phosphate isomerase-like protein (cupin superfamily)